MIRLGTADRITVNFDLISDSHEYLRCRLLHCNADWTPSRLQESEYLESFNEFEVTDYAYSANTYVHYVNYSITIPEGDMQPLVSGNYILQVFPDNDPDDIWLQTRFEVSENTSEINGLVSSRTDKGFNSEWQQLTLEVDIAGTEIKNPYQDLIVTVTQNNRPETTRILTHPMRTDGTKVIFEHDPKLIFKAGNEYRRFETVRADYPGMGVDSVRFDGNFWNAYISRALPRSHTDYVYDRTQHGRFAVDEYNSSDPNLGADYVKVHFSLQPTPELNGQRVYVDGDFTNHEFTDTNRLHLNPESGMLELEMALKQGSYNYQFVTIDESTGMPDPSPVEGDFHDTGNEYLVNVYLRQTGSRADRLIGSTLLNSDQ